MSRQNSLDNFVIITRKIKSDILDEKLTKDEFALLMWIRVSATPYGVAVINLQSLREDLFKNKASVNHINKLMLNLKKEQYLFYKYRSGCRGSFEVHLPEFILPKDAGVTSIKKRFDDEARELTGKQTLFGQSFDTQKQSLNDSDDDMEQSISKFFPTSKYRASNTDTKTNIKR